jgi:hypothetical protein
MDMRISDRSRLLQRLSRMQLQREDSSDAVRRIGFDPEARMAAVVFTGSETVYGYPNLSDEEIQQFIEVREQHGSLGHFVSTVIKANHDHERVEWEPG